MLGVSITLTGVEGSVSPKLKEAHDVLRVTAPVLILSISPSTKNHHKL